MILNPWDVQSKHINTTDGVAPPLYAGECRWAGGEIYVLVRIKDELPEDNRTADGE